MLAGAGTRAVHINRRGTAWKRGCVLASDAEVLKRSPLGDQLLLAHKAIAAPLVGLEPVLLAQGGELLPQGVEDGVVVVQGTEANNQTLTEVEDPWRPLV